MRTLCVFISWRQGSLSVNASIAGSFEPRGIASSTETAYTAAPAAIATGTDAPSRPAATPNAAPSRIRHDRIARAVAGV